MIIKIPEEIYKNHQDISNVVAKFGNSRVTLHAETIKKDRFIIHDDIYNKCSEIEFIIDFISFGIKNIKCSKDEMSHTYKIPVKQKIKDGIPGTLIKKNIKTEFNDNDEDKIIILDKLKNLAKATDTITDKKVQTGKNLIYYSIFDNDNGYIDLLYKSLLSLWDFPINADVLLITDNRTKGAIEDILLKFKRRVHYLIVDTPADGIDASKTKTQIFNFDKIDEYENILFLDCDILITKNLNTIFDETLNYNTLYTAYNKNLTLEFHKKSRYHGFAMISAELFNCIEKNNQMPFNAGQFLFKNSKKMREHFNNINWFMNNWPGDYFFEQAFMNYYFCAYNLTNCSLFDKYVNLIPNGKFEMCSSDAAILHFIGPALDAYAKIDHIIQYTKINNI